MILTLPTIRQAQAELAEQMKEEVRLNQLIRENLAKLEFKE